MKSTILSLAVVCLLFVACKGREGASLKSESASDSGDHQCNIVSTMMNFVAPQGGYTGGRLVITVKKDVNPESVYAKICIRCNNGINGDPSASEDWIDVKASELGSSTGNGGYPLQYVANFDFGGNIGNPSMWINYVAYYKKQGQNIFDNNMTTGTSVRVEGYKGKYPDDLKNNVYSNRCNEAFSGLN